MFECTRWQLSKQVLFVDEPLVLRWQASLICVFDETKNEPNAEIETTNLVKAVLQTGACTLLQVLDLQL